MTVPRRRLDVLVADDDPLLLEAIAMMVAGFGCDVQTAPDGAVAAALLASRHFDVLITDWQMPALDGVGLARALRSQRSDDYLHIVMMTTRAAERTVREAVDVEIDDFLFKPIDPVMLELSIESARRTVILQHRLARRNHHLQAAIARTRAAYRHIRNDLAAAAATQRSLLPPVQLTGALRHAWLFIPSLWVGGDSLNVRRLSDGQRFFFLLDVSGHGVPAALRSFSLHHRISARPPADCETMMAMVRALNRDAQDEPEGAYYTMLCGLITADGSRADYIRAGHPAPIHLHASGTSQPEAGDPPIGLLPGLRFGVHSIELGRGDRLVMHSDGITDCTARDGTPFGDARLHALLQEHAGSPLPRLVEGLDSRLREYRGIGDFEDDISLLMFERG